MLSPDKLIMRGATTPAGTAALVPPSGATPTIAMPERKRKRKGNKQYFQLIAI